jgi:hypothetical protein
MPGQYTLRVFVSSTYEDLIAERDKVRHTLIRAGCFPVGMEGFPAVDEETWKHIQTQIASTDVFLLIIAGRYGSLAEDKTGYVEKEFDYANQLGLPVIAFLHKDINSLAFSKVDTDPVSARRRAKFIGRIKNERHVSFFGTPDDLALSIVLSINRLQNKQAVRGRSEETAIESKQRHESAANNPVHKLVDKLKVFGSVQDHSVDPPKLPQTADRSAKALAERHLQLKRSAEARFKGFEHSACDDCGNYTLVRDGNCAMCNTCGSSSGCG